MTGEAGYRALEKGDLIAAFNEFSAAEKNVTDDIEKSKMIINKGALLIAMGKYRMAVEELIKAKAKLKALSSECSNKLLSVACLNLAKAMLATGRAENAEAELRCAEKILGSEDPHVMYVKALVYFYRNDVQGLSSIDTDKMPEPYNKLVKVLVAEIEAKNGSDKAMANYEDALREAVPSSRIREAFGLV
jgi:tetratricopeptide (TPR) repeat protein